MSRARKPSRGRVYWSTIRAIDTVLNLLYIGNRLKQSLVKPIKWLPQASMTAKMLAAMSHHFSFPLQSRQPSRKRKKLRAPMYIGPAVKGCGPQ